MIQCRKRLVWIGKVYTAVYILRKEGLKGAKIYGMLLANQLVLSILKSKQALP